MNCSMDRLPSGSVFVSPLAQFSMSPDKALRSGGGFHCGVQTCQPDLRFCAQSLIASSRISSLRCFSSGGSPPGIPGSTNAMRVHCVGDAVSGVAPAYR